jgi:hypothetical protein
MKNADKAMPGSSAGPFFKKERTPSKIAIRPSDLMSRRHPLSSTRAFRFKIRFEKQTVLMARVTCRHQVAGIFCKASYFFFLETFLVFLAVFFTALFAFFAFLAFLAMLPSGVSEITDQSVTSLDRCVHSGIEMHYIPNTPTRSKKQRPA